jgi:hypothetical protein
VLASPRPFRAIRQLRRRVAQLPGRFRLLHDDPWIFPSRLMVCLLAPAACTTSTPGCPAPHPGYTPGVHYLVVGRPPFDEPLEELPCGLCRIDARRPQVFAVASPARPKAKHGDPERRPGLTAQPLRLLVWSPRAGLARLVLTVATADGSGPGSPCCLRVSDAGGRMHAVQFAGGAPAELSIRLPADISRLEVRCVQGEGRLTGARLQLVDEYHKGNETAQASRAVQRVCP